MRGGGMVAGAIAAARVTLVTVIVVVSGPAADVVAIRGGSGGGVFPPRVGSGGGTFPLGGKGGGVFTFLPPPPLPSLPASFAVGGRTLSGARDGRSVATGSLETNLNSLLPLVVVAERGGKAGAAVGDSPPREVSMS